MGSSSIWCSGVELWQQVAINGVCQIALKLSMFWTAAMLMEAVCYRGILEITFGTAGSGIADAGLA